MLLDITCGNGMMTMNEFVPNFTHTIYNLIRIGVPILLVLFGMLDLGKAVMAQKEDEIKKGQQTFAHRLIAAAIVFLVFFIVQIVFNLVVPKGAEGGDRETIWGCVNCFISGSSKCDPQK